MIMSLTKFKAITSKDDWGEGVARFSAKTHALQRGLVSVCTSDSGFGIFAE